MPAFAACDSDSSNCSASEAFSQRDSRPSDAAPVSTSKSESVPNVRTLSNGAQIRMSADGKSGIDRWGRHVNFDPNRP